MRRVACITAVLLCCLEVGCGNGCESLVNEACERHGDDSITCVSRTQELDELGRKDQRLCDRALILYRSLAESELSE